MSERRRQPRSRRRLALGGAIVALAILVIVVLLVERRPVPITDDGSAPTAAIPVDSLVEVNAVSGKIIHVLPDMPASASSLPQVETGEGGVWVLSGGQLSHIDPNTATLVGSVTIGTAGFLTANDLAIGSRTVLVASVPGVVRVNPLTERALRSVRLGPSGVEIAEDVAIANHFGGWAVESNGELTRFDPFTGRITGGVDIGQSASALAVGFDAVWVIDGFGGTLTRVEPESLRTDVFEVQGQLDDVAAGAGAVWILDSSVGAVIPFDPASESLGKPIRVGLDPTDIAVGLDTVWVANHGDATISRIDPVTQHAEPIDVGAPVATVAVEDSTESVWVTIATERGAG